MPFDLMEEIKEHPVPAALVAGGVVIGFLILSGAFSSSGQASTSTGGLDPATAQLYAQTEAIQAQSQQQSNALAAQQTLADTQANYGLSLAQIQANAQTTQTNTAASVSLAQINADAQTSQQSIAAQLQAAQDQIGVSTDEINASLQGLEDTNATTATIASLTAGEQEQIAQITGNTQVALSNNATQAAIATTNAAASVAKGAQGVTEAGGIENTVESLGSLGLIGALAFSDIRLKQDVRLHHVDADGVRWFTFSYRGQNNRHLGVMAHEVPDYVALDAATGMLKVDYRALRRRALV